MKPRGEVFWKTGVSFYFDGVGFAHKTNPYQQACAPRGKILRKPAEGLDPYCTAKGQKVGSGGRVVKVFAAIS